MTNPHEALEPISALVFAVVFTVAWLRIRKIQNERR